MKEKNAINQSLYYSGLISGYLAGTLTDEEKVILSHWIDASSANKALFIKLTNFNNLRDNVKIVQNFNDDEAYANIKKNIAIYKNIKQQKVTAWDEFKENWWRTIYGRLNVATISIAALMLMIGFGWLYFSEEEETIVTSAIVSVQDVESAQLGATLTLPDGRKIRLDAVSEGKLVQENGISITKTEDGQLLYELFQYQEDALGSDTNDTSLNILSTARGEIYSVKLPDGSIVHLNSATTLEYPMNFLHTKFRKVTLSGEAYFEIAHQKQKPFIVEYKNQQAEVLGTEFNISAYDNEKIAITTLVNGSLRVSTESQPPIVLVPGNATFFNGSALISRKVDVTEFTAWRQGKFSFNNTAFEDVARQFSRWYNIDVVYAKGKVPETKFSGEMNRNVSLKTVLGYFKDLGINFKVENRKLIIE